MSCSKPLDMKPFQDMLAYATCHRISRLLNKKYTFLLRLVTLHCLLNSHPVFSSRISFCGGSESVLSLQIPTAIVRDASQCLWQLQGKGLNGKPEYLELLMQPAK